MKTVMTVIGTRPEMIKLNPVNIALSNNPYFKNEICITRQHEDLLDSFILNANLQTIYMFESRQGNLTLSQNAAHMLSQFSKALDKLEPDVIIVQGDTSSAFVASLAGFYSGIPVAHVEAGLRTGNVHSPWPEEAHRCFIDKVSTYFFTPTDQAKTNLLQEGVHEDKIWVVGNTSIDAMRLLRVPQDFNQDFQERFIIVTIHRRENQGKVLEEICDAIVTIARKFLDIKILFFLHPNPSISEVVKRLLSQIENITLMQPIDHASFVHLLQGCIFVMTDSGGIQEEVTFTSTPILIIRNNTERVEVVESGKGILVGTNKTDIINICIHLLSSSNLLTSMSKVNLSYGDGYAAEKIVSILEKEFKQGDICST